MNFDVSSDGKEILLGNEVYIFLIINRKEQWLHIILKVKHLRNFLKPINNVAIL